MDSLGNKTNLCVYSPNTFIVSFKKTSYNKKTAQVRLMGRLNRPMPDVGLYLSDSNKIHLSQAFAHTTYDTVDIDKGGFFDVSINVKPNQSLYFYHHQIYSRQYELYKLLR
jgi:hypothetical protein